MVQRYGQDLSVVGGDIIERDDGPYVLAYDYDSVNESLKRLVKSVNNLGRFHMIKTGNSFENSVYSEFSYALAEAQDILESLS